MPQEPKRRHSRQRKGKRRASIKLEIQKGIICPNCKKPTLPHVVCRYCGFYKGKPIIKKSSKATVKKLNKEKKD